MGASLQWRILQCGDSKEDAPLELFTCGSADPPDMKQDHRRAGFLPARSEDPAERPDTYRVAGRRSFGCARNGRNKSGIAPIEALDEIDARLVPLLSL